MFWFLALNHCTSGVYFEYGTPNLMSHIKKTFFTHFHTSIIYFQRDYTVYYLLKAFTRPPSFYGEEHINREKVNIYFYNIGSLLKIFTQEVFLWANYLVVITVCLHGICPNIAGEHSKHPQYIFSVDIALRIVTVYHLSHRWIFCILRDYYENNCVNVALLQHMFKDKE